MKTAAIIGGGAAGMTAAILLKEAGFDVTLFERQDRIGKKILQTGNGRCNISHTGISEKNYVGRDTEKIRKILSSFDEKRERAFLSGLGIELCERDGCLYPVSRQASSVLDAYRFRLAERKVRILTDTEVTGIRQRKNGYELLTKTPDGNRGYGDFAVCILACGGMAGVYQEAAHNGYEITKAMGHSLTGLHPALTPVRCEEDFKAAAGIRADAGLTLTVNGKVAGKEQGEVQFTDSGLSGIPVFQLTLLIRDPERTENRIALDLLGFLGDDNEAAYGRFTKRAKAMKERTLEEFFAGWLQKKLAVFLIKNAGLKTSSAVSDFTEKDLDRLYHTARNLTFKVKKCGDWRSAQIQCGGVPMEELNERLESRKMKGIYLIGEMLDAAGMCGGYNLHFALASAHCCADALIGGAGQ